MPVTVYETDLGVYLNKNGDFKNLKWKAGKEMVEVEIDDLNELKGDNAVLVAQMQKKCFPIFKDGANPLIRLLEKADALDTESTVASLKGASLAASAGLANDSVQAAHDVYVTLRKKSGAG